MLLSTEVNATTELAAVLTGAARVLSLIPVRDSVIVLIIPIPTPDKFRPRAWGGIRDRLQPILVSKRSLINIPLRMILRTS